MLAVLLCQLSVSQLGDSMSGQAAAAAPTAQPAHVSAAAGSQPSLTVAPLFADRWEGLPLVPSTTAWESTTIAPASAALEFVEPNHGVQDEPPLLGAAPLDIEVQASASQPHGFARLKQLLRRRIGCDLGIGHERVMFAPHVVETAIGTANTSLLMRVDRGLSTPDRLEAIWAAPSRGPAAETRVDILDTVLRMELGNTRLLAMTDYTLRSLNPERNDNTTGFGDMTLGVKGTIHDGLSTKISSVFRTYLKTGPTDRGLGTGHVSLEPGFLMLHQLNTHTFFHGEAKYWLPIGGTPQIAGDVLKLGAALSTVWKETDTTAILPTLEFSSYTFLAGGATEANGLGRRVNGEFAAELYPGLRWVRGPDRELGLLEYGLASGFIFADEGWFDTRLVFDIRFVR